MSLAMRSARLSMLPHLLQVRLLLPKTEGYFLNSEVSSLDG